MTPEKIARAMGIWAEALEGFIPHQQIPALLGIAITKDREHFDATARWLIDTDEQTFIEAVAFARHNGILRSWDDAEAAAV